jgi:hypothetical protein
MPRSKRALRVFEEGMKIEQHEHAVLRRAFDVAQRLLRIARLGDALLAPVAPRDTVGGRPREQRPAVARGELVEQRQYACLLARFHHDERKARAHDEFEVVGVVHAVLPMIFERQDARVTRKTVFVQVFVPGVLAFHISCHSAGSICRCRSL